MREKDIERIQEIFRRLHHVIEIHPYLSGLLTDEHQRYLKELAEELDILYPEGEPDYSKLIDEF